MKYLAQQIDNFTSINILPQYADYNPATTYIVEADTALTDASVALYNNYYYRSITNANIGENPETSSKWIKWDVSNRYAMIDLSSQTKSVKEADDLIVEFTRGDIESLAIGNFETTQIIVEHLDNLGAVIPNTTEVSDYTVNEEVIDYWSYMFEPYSIGLDRGELINVAPIGEKLRVTFKKHPDVNRASCGFLVGGQPVDMGTTLSNVGFHFNSYATKETDSFGTLTINKRAVQDLVDFETKILDTKTMRIKREVKKIYNDIIVFIVDPSDDSIHENMLTLGAVQDVGVLITTLNKTLLTWSIYESI